MPKHVLSALLVGGVLLLAVGIYCIDTTFAPAPLSIGPAGSGVPPSTSTVSVATGTSISTGTWVSLDDAKIHVEKDTVAPTTLDEICQATYLDGVLRKPLNMHQEVTVSSSDSDRAFVVSYLLRGTAVAYTVGTYQTHEDVPRRPSGMYVSMYDCTTKMTTRLSGDLKDPTFILDADTRYITYDTLHGEHNTPKAHTYGVYSLADQQVYMIDPVHNSAVDAFSQGKTLDPQYDSVDTVAIRIGSAGIEARIVLDRTDLDTGDIQAISDEWLPIELKKQ